MYYILYLFYILIIIFELYDVNHVIKSFTDKTV